MRSSNQCQQLFRSRHGRHGLANTLAWNMCWLTCMYMIWTRSSTVIRLRCDVHLPRNDCVGMQHRQGQRVPDGSKVDPIVLVTQLSLQSFRTTSLSALLPSNNLISTPSIANSIHHTSDPFLLGQSRHYPPTLTSIAT